MAPRWVGAGAAAGALWARAAATRLAIASSSSARSREMARIAEASSRRRIASRSSGPSAGVSTGRGSGVALGVVAAMMLLSRTTTCSISAASAGRVGCSRYTVNHLTASSKRPASTQA